MKKLEIIKLIIEEEPSISLANLLIIDETYLLIKLCCLNKKYLNDDNLNYIIDNYKKYPLNNTSFNYSTKIAYLYLSSLISNYPNIVNKLPDNIINNITIDDWSNILQKQPNLFDKCKVVDDFTSNNWETILSEQPQLAFRYRNIYKEFNLYNMSYLIEKSKKILNYIDINKIKIDKMYLSNIIPIYPEIIKILDKKTINSISLINWLNMIEINPNLIDICPKTINNKVYSNYPNNIINLVAKEPKFKYLLPSINNIPEHLLVNLVIKQPQLVEELNINLDMFDVYQWGNILKKQPRFIDRCKILNKIPSYNSSLIDWVSIISEQPKLIDYCKKINEFNGLEWVTILKKQPQLVDKCDIDLYQSYLSDLLFKQPSLIKKLNTNNLSDSSFKKVVYNSKEYHIKAIEKYTKKYKDTELLTNMIAIYPDLKEIYIEKDLWKYVDFSKLTDNLEYAILK